MIVPDSVVDDAIKSSICRHLGVHSQWVGNPKDSTFGIWIELTWDGCPFTGTQINFLEDKNY